MGETYDKLNHWYGWNGGECPVHPETEVEIIFIDERQNTYQRTGISREQHWSHFGAFRITKLYVEPRKPREWWINVYEAGELDPAFAYESEREANENADPHRLECVCFREVLPEDEP